MRQSAELRPGCSEATSAKAKQVPCRLEQRVCDRKDLGRWLFSPDTVPKVQVFADRSRLAAKEVVGDQLLATINDEILEQLSELSVPAERAGVTFAFAGPQKRRFLQERRGGSRGPARQRSSAESSAGT